MKTLYNEGKLDEIQARFISDERPEEELYDLEKDPYETLNLVNSTEYEEILNHHRQILTNWIKNTDDKGQYSESESVLRILYERWGDKCVNPEYNGVKLNEQTK